MTDDTRELDEIEQVVRAVLTPNSYIVPQEGIELTKALLDWHNKQTEEVLDRLEKEINTGRTQTADYVISEAIEAERNKLKETK